MFWRKFIQRTSARVGIFIAAVLLFFIIFAPVVSPHHPNAQKLEEKLAAPSVAHPFGTDQFGRDLLARAGSGGRRSLAAAAAVLAATLVFSLILGVAFGMIGGAVDAAAMRVADVLLAVPSLVLALGIVGALGVGFENLMLALVISSLAFYTRLVRSYALRAGRRLDVTAARLAGVGWARIVAGHVLPAVFRQVLIAATLDLGGVIVALAGFSFLGLGVQPPAAEWGAMLGEARLYFTVAPWLLIFPGLLIFLSVASANLIGNALRDASDVQ